MKPALVNILTPLVVLLFLLNYPIAEWLAPWNKDPDQNLSIRFNEYALIICGVFLISQNKQTRFSTAVLQIGVGLCLGDVLDRFIFDVTNFQWNDVLTIIISVSTSYYKNYYVRKGC